MATRLLSLYQHLWIYRRQNLRILPYYLRYFSSQKRDSEISEQPQNPSKVNPELEPISKWLNIRAGILGPEDERLPYPGNIGLSYELRAFIGKCERDSRKIDFLQMARSLGAVVDTNLLLTSKERNIKEMQKYQEMFKELFRFQQVNDGGELLLECKVQQCPKLLKRDFAVLFPDENIGSQELTVLTLCQKTVNDMNGWSEDMEVEREELISQFTERAQMICNNLIDQGYWADFIDPSSGRPSLGAFTNSTFFETDERFRYFGFKIEDLGCCKIISHGAWGTHIFVGAIFSNAPVYSDAIEDALNAINVKGKS